MFNVDITFFENSPFPKLCLFLFHCKHRGKGTCVCVRVCVCVCVNACMRACMRVYVVCVRAHVQQ